jgi:hypothetical protein
MICDEDKYGINLYPGTGGQVYQIDWGRCDTPAKVCEWVAHLAEKNWVTVPMIESFIHRAFSHHGIKLWGNY